MTREKLATVPLLIILTASVIGMGFGLEYSATTINGGNSLSTTYMLIDLENENEECRFEFDNLVYYRNRTIDNGVTDTYESKTIESGMMTLEFTGHNIETGTAITKYVKLSENNTAAVFKLQFYQFQNNDPIVYGSPITLSATDQEIQLELDLEVVYGCKLIVTVNDQTLSQASSDTLSFGVIFNATASLGDA